LPLNKLDSIIKNTDGRIIYVSPSDLDSTDSIDNQGNSLNRPFKTLQRALIESARFSYVRGSSNDIVEKTTILLMPGSHVIDNRPGYTIDSGGAVITSEGDSSSRSTFNLSLNSNLDLTDKNNDLYKFNSVYGGVIVPRGTSIVGLDLRKTKIRPLYVPNPTFSSISNSAILRLTGACYVWQFSIFDGDDSGTVYTQPDNFDIKSIPTFSHHKLSVFEYADGVNEVGTKGLTDLQMYYAKLSYAYSSSSGRGINTADEYLENPEGFSPRRPEYEIVGAFSADPISIASIISGDGLTASRVITVTTVTPHGLDKGTPIRISGVSQDQYNISTKVASISDTNDSVFTYVIESDPRFLTPSLTSQGIVNVDTDTVSGASPYVFNVSMRSVWGMNGLIADGNKATGFRSIVISQFTGISLQKDDRSFVKYDASNGRTYSGLTITEQSGSELSANSSSSGIVYHLDSDSVYRKDWQQSHIKIKNDAILQIVSVFAIGYSTQFVSESGGDASITNSNSNFGQLSLVSEGFKKTAFDKDNKAFITHIISPRAVDQIEDRVDWLSIDDGVTTSVGDSNKIYLAGFKNETVPPPSLTQGYRIGARVSDKLYLTLNNVEYSADIVIPSSNQSSFEEYLVGEPSSNIFTLSSGTHSLSTGEKVIIISEDADLPENLRTNVIYYAITPSNNTIKLAATESEALSGQEINVFGGTNLKIQSRVSDKSSGDVRHPIQWDSIREQWYINVINNLITPQLSGSGITEPLFVKRISDSRSLDEKIYKVRVVVPRQLTNGKNPEPGFVIQESSSTGFFEDDDGTKTTIDSTDFDYNKNLRFISTCSFSSPTVTVISEIPHNLNVGDTVIIKNVTDSSVSGLAYNGTHTVTSITNELTFTYDTELTPGSFTNDTSVRTKSLPRFERNDLQSNLYIYRNEIISEYDEGERNGVYNFYVLNSNNQVQTEFTDLKYGQNVVDLYPQNDRDNISENPRSAKSYALRSPIGDVQTNDLRNSITRESIDLFVKTLGIGNKISSISGAGTTNPIITFDRNHNFNSIVIGSINASPTGFTAGTYYNVKIYNNSLLTIWNGATAKVIVSGAGNITSAEIINGGSGYSAGTYYLDTNIIGSGSNNDFTVASDGISSPIGQVVQFTGVGTTSDNYHRISAVNSANQITIERSTSEPVIVTDQYALLVAPSTSFTSIGNTITAPSHGLVVGNRFKSIDSSNNNLGDYIVDSVINVNTFTISGVMGSTSGFILKHGLSSNAGISDGSNENLEVRGITIFDGEKLTLTESGGIDSSETQFSVSHSGIGTAERFSLGSYIKVDGEIMRIASNSLSGVPADKITVIRGVFSSKQKSHPENSLITKIKIPAVEFRRPSIIRASGHTFEYLGYGPGNYSTALPQVQNKTLSEREEFLVQSQERSSGIVVYNGMNNKGDFFIGNQKKSSTTGEETTFDTPIPTVTGQSVSRLSEVFDEVTIKERLIVEGGDSGQSLSQFDGSVTFNSETRFTNSNGIEGSAAINVSNTKQSTATNSGALIVAGGVGIGKDLYVGGTIYGLGGLSISLINISPKQVLFSNSNSFLDGDNKFTFEQSTSTLGINSISVYESGGNSYIEEIDSKDLILKAYSSDKLIINGVGVSITGNLDVTGDVNSFSTSDEKLKDNIIPIHNPLEKVISISGNTFDWNENSNKEGHDVGLIAQEIQKILPEAVKERDDGYLAVDYKKIIPLLVESIKELSNKVESIEHQLKNK